MQRLEKSGRATLSRRLKPYWQMERACAFIFPPLTFAWVRPADLISASILALALIACCSTLWVGAAYWRAVWAMLENSQASIVETLEMAARWQPLCCGTAVLGVVACALAMLSIGANAATITASGFSILAVLEYINYYHVQLQNFDHGPTFRRFLKRRTFPRAHLAKNLEIFRKSRSRPS